MGLGKTFASLSIYAHFKFKNDKLKAMVACPLSLIEGAWRGECEDMGLKMWNLNDTLFEPAEWDVVALNYESFVRSRKRLEVLNKIVEKNELMAILDESQNIKTHNSKTTKMFLSSSSHFKHRICMSGTPAPLDETDYWSQIRFVNADVFSKNFFLFRNKYFHLTNGESSITLQSPRQAMEWYRRGFKYKINPKMKNEFFYLIDSVSHSANKEECLDLPEKSYVTKYCYMNDEVKTHYNMMSKLMVAIINDKQITASLALSKIMKLRQITSGFLLDNGTSINLKTNPKLELLKETLEEIGDKQVIIWASFVHDIRMITETLGDKAECIYGDVDKEDRPAILERFRTGKTKYLVANPSTVGFGITLTNCSYSIYYSLSHEGELYFQSQDRIHRIGQASGCTYIHLIMKDTVDETILNSLTNKWDSQKLLWEFKNTLTAK
jgi:SNF2 family DNA or RNA helicase